MMLFRNALTAMIALVAAAAYSTNGYAQTVTSQVFAQAVPFTYDRGRNESVNDRPRPDWEPTGIDFGGFTALPKLDVTAGYTSNVFQDSPAARKGDAILAVEPSLVVRSDWSRNALKLDASGHFVRYANTPSRDEDGYSVGAVGKIDVGGGDRTLNLGARTSQVYENQFSSVGVASVRSARPVQASLFNALADIRFTRVRAVLAGDYSDFAYRPVQTFDGTTLDQTNRNRRIMRGIGHLEYGLTPDTGGFLQVAYSDARYRYDLAPGIANRNSSEIRALAGISFDLTALLRGSFGAGYINRNYRSTLYRDIKGLSLAGKIEYFPSELTTVTLTGRRDIEDSAIAGASGYFDTGVGLRVDHELLRNVILHAGGDYEKDSYRGVKANANIFRFSAGGRYLLSRALQLNGRVSYNERNSNSALIGPTVNELRITASISIRR